jgi:hypothetical protein
MVSLTASIRYELLALPTAGLLFTVGILLRGPSLDPARGPERFARAITAPAAPLAWFLILGGMILSLYGLWALGTYLAGSRHPRMVRWGWG